MSMLKALSTMHRFFSKHPLTRDRKRGAWLRFADWQVRSRLQEEVVVPWVGGQRLAARRRMNGATGNIYAGLHEFTDMMVLCHLLREDDLFLDVGANIGSYTVLAAGICRANVISFEPDPQTAAYFRRNMSLNGLEERVELHEVAVGEREATVRFTVGKGTVNRVIDDASVETREVRLKTLDQIVGERNPTMIKVDVEGHEEQVMRGAEKTLRNASLKVIELETVTTATRTILADHGFQVLHYDPFTRSLEEKPRHISSNTLFVKDVAFVAERLASAAAVTVLGRSI